MGHADQVEGWPHLQARGIAGSEQQKVAQWLLFLVVAGLHVSGSWRRAEGFSEFGVGVYGLRAEGLTVGVQGCLDLIGSQLNI